MSAYSHSMSAVPLPRTCRSERHDCQLEQVGLGSGDKAGPLAGSAMAMPALQMRAFGGRLGEGLFVDALLGRIRDVWGVRYGSTAILCR